MFINTVTLEYPLDLQGIRQAYPSVSFPQQPSDADLRPHGFASVAPAEPPLPDDDEALEELPPQEQDGTWRQRWRVRAATESELLQRCNYRAFWDALITSDAYQSIRSQACQNLALNTACTELMAAISDAKQGHANRAFLQACLESVAAAATLSAEDWVELGQALAAGNLQYVYSLPR